MISIYPGWITESWEYCGGEDVEDQYNAEMLKQG